MNGTITFANLAEMRATIAGKSTIAEFDRVHAMYGHPRKGAHPEEVKNGIGQSAVRWLPDLDGKTLLTYMRDYTSWRHDQFERDQLELFSSSPEEFEQWKANQETYAPGWGVARTYPGIITRPGGTK